MSRVPAPVKRIDRPAYAEAFHALQKSWALRIKNEPLFERRQALYRQAYDHMFRFTRDHISAEKHEFGFDAGFLWGPHAVMRGGDVLEMGSGLGSAGLMMTRWARRVYAIEASTEGREVIGRRAEAAGIRNLEVRDDDIRLGGFSDGSIDVVYSNDFIEHLTEEDANVFLRSAFRVLRPRGTIFTVTPNRLAGPHDSTQWFASIGSTAEGFHLREYNYAELCAALRAAGFTHLRARIPFYADFPFRPPYVPAWLMLMIERRVTDWASSFAWKVSAGMVNISARKPR